MTNWQDIQKEIAASNNNFDTVRRAKYKLVSDITGRPLLVYVTAFHNPIKAQIAAPFLAIDISDKDGFDEIIRNVNAKEVDVFIHSPGGSADATESIVKMLRKKFDNVRFIVTGGAKSAATMLALSGDCILMSSAAELGPIDPQVRVKNRFSPAGSIIEQFSKAAEQLKKDPTQLPVWIPILQEFAPSLLVECSNFIELSNRLVTSWLKDYMFKGEEKAEEKATKIAKHLNDEKNSLSHARRIDAEQLKSLGVKIELLEEQDEKLQDAIRQLHLSIMATLDSTAAAKIFENSEGAVMIKAVMMQQLPNQPLQK